MYESLKWSLHGDAFVHEYLLLIHGFCLAVVDLGDDSKEAITHIQAAYPELITRVRITNSNPGIGNKLMMHYCVTIGHEYGLSAIRMSSCCKFLCMAQDMTD